MGKATRVRDLPANVVTGFDATPERLAKNDDSEIVAAAILSATERRGKARQFTVSQLDRWKKSGIVTYRQWLAGDHYRNTHHSAKFSLSVVACYGERSNPGEGPGTFGYGLPRQEAAASARQHLRDMRAQWPQELQGYMDRLLIHDTLPRYGGRAHHHSVTKIRNALEELCRYLGY
jgi:hypothetical protein